MRVPKAYLIIGTLLPLGIAGWTVLPRLLSRPVSAEQQRAEADAFAAGFLRSQLPQQPYDIHFVFEGSGGKPIQIFPALLGKSLIGRQMGPSEWKQLETWTPFYTAMQAARKTMDHQAWKTLGEARITSAGGSSSVIVQLYETPGSRLGFQHDGSFYQAEGGACKEFLDFIHDTQKGKAA